MGMWMVHGRRLRGTFPKKIEVGDGPCIRPPNIWRSSVIGCVAKHELTKKGVMKECFLKRSSEIVDVKM